MKFFKYYLACFLILTITHSALSQGFLRKLKNKVEDKVLDEVFEEEKNETKRKSDSDPSNTTGGGLIVEAPDVVANITDGERAYQSKSYSDARYAIRQAILGVEMEMGENLLNSLPESVAGLPVKPEDDEVASTSVGFVGLTIKRSYQQGNKEVDVTIANNSVLMASVNAYLSNNAYASSSSEQQYKQIKVQGYRGVIEYDDYSGYKLSVPIGQSSIFVMEAVNFANENEVMSAADQFNLNEVKEQLGEQ